MKNKIFQLYSICKKSESNFYCVLFRLIYYKIFYKLDIIAHPKVKIQGIENIITHNSLYIGTAYVGTSLKSDKTFLNLKGTLIIEGPYLIGRGCRLDISEGATLKIGKGGFTNINSTFIISHGVEIGDDCSISWGCQFLDNDFHEINYENKPPIDPKINIGNHVWVGCNVSIYKGTKIPEGCVIAANSVVRGVFNEPNALIAGNPAKIIKHNIKWKP